MPLNHLVAIAFPPSSPPVIIHAPITLLSLYSLECSPPQEPSPTLLILPLVYLDYTIPSPAGQVAFNLTAQNLPYTPLSPARKQSIHLHHHKSSRHSRNLPKKSPHHGAVHHGIRIRIGRLGSFRSRRGLTLRRRLRDLLPQLALRLWCLLPFDRGYTPQLRALPRLSSLSPAEMVPLPAV